MQITERHHSSVFFGDLEGRIEDSGGKRFFCLSFNDGDIYDFEKKVLRENLCDLLLEVCFMQDKGKESVYYNFSGYIQLKNIFPGWREQKKNLSWELCRMLSIVIQCVKTGQNYLLSDKGFSLNPDTVFINPETSEVRLAYIPGLPKKDTLQECFSDLISATMNMSDDDQWESYGKAILEEISANNPGFSEIDKFIRNKSREIYSVLWPDKYITRDMISEDKETPDGKAATDEINRAEPTKKPEGSRSMLCRFAIRKFCSL